MASTTYDTVLNGTIIMKHKMETVEINGHGQFKNTRSTFVWME
jgi:hypothetical protein